MDVPPEDYNSQHGQEDNFNSYRSMRDHMHPPRMSAPSCIVPPIEQLVIRPHIMPLLPTFHGMESENPYSHIKEFEEVSIVNLSKVVGDFVGDQKSNNAQLNKRIDSVESTLNKRMDGMQNDLSQKIDNVQYTISRLTNLNTVHEKGKFPSQPHQNPKGIHEVEAQEGESSKVREVKAVITLRSGKEVDQPTSKPKHDEESVTEKERKEERENAIIQCKSPVKYKDPGCPTILVSIGGTCVEKALFDLGASVNLLPYSVYKQLGLGELKPTSITLSLVDRSVKIPRGMIEDVLVQVDKFYYLVDFVVLDTDSVVK
ncbi:hypothetical protein AAG906_005392 [Vitis piasezkii]